MHFFTTKHFQLNSDALYFESHNIHATLDSVDTLTSAGTYIHMFEHILFSYVHMFQDQLQKI